MKFVILSAKGLVGRICELALTPEHKSYGFSLAKNSKGPHKIHFVENDSLAYNAGLKVGDLILKINDFDLVGKSYTNTVKIMKKEGERGRFQLEVIDPNFCSASLKNRSISYNDLDEKAGYGNNYLCFIWLDFYYY